MLDAFIATTRFGLGARPGELAAAAGDPRGWLVAQLDGPDRAADRRLARSQPSEASVREVAAMRDPDARKQLMMAARGRYIEEAGLHLQVAADSERPFRERLVAFWSNHFTVSVARREVLGVAAGFERDVVRANLDTSFADMLLASTQHPAMLAYLDHLKSTGPGSRAGGVRAVRDLATHPSTALHVATRMARHFVADVPPQAAVQALEDAFRGFEGDLPTVHRALVDVSEAWEAPLGKVRRPWDLVVATARALELEGVGEGMVAGLKELGQLPWGAPSPKGWSDDAVDWMGPEQVLGRVEWLEQVVDRVGRRSGLAVAEAVFGLVLSETTRRALERDDDLLVALACPEFQRR